MIQYIKKDSFGKNPERCNVSLLSHRPGRQLVFSFSKSTDMIAHTPNAPYYAVIFTSIRTEGDHGYEAMAEKMLELAKQQDGFLGVESARNELGITVSYWRDLESIKKWKEHGEHTIAREFGRKIWYEAFKTRIAKVESDYDFYKH